jgi:hypothetical protein
MLLIREIQHIKDNISIIFNSKKILLIQRMEDDAISRILMLVI